LLVYICQRFIEQTQFYSSLFLKQDNGLKQKQVERAVQQPTFDFDLMNLKHAMQGERST